MHILFLQAFLSQEDKYALKLNKADLHGSCLLVK
jgi:hypothetical protein